MAAARRAVAEVLRSLAATARPSSAVINASFSADLLRSLAATSRSGSAIVHPATSSAILHASSATAGSSAIVPAPSSAVVHGPASATARSSTSVPVPSYAAAGPSAFHPEPLSVAAGPTAFHQEASSVPAGYGAFHCGSTSAAARSGTSPATGFHLESSSVAPGSGASHRVSTSTAARSDTSPPARLGFISARLTRPKPTHFKTQRRYTHSKSKKIPAEVEAELQRIEADGLKRHKELTESIAGLNKQVSDWSKNAKANKAEATWQMGKIAWMVCSSVLASAAITGYGVLKLVRFGGGKESQEVTAQLLEQKVSQLKDDLKKHMDAILEMKDEEEAASLRKTNLELDEKARLLDKKQAELEVREALVAAKEAAARGRPKE